MNSIDLALRNRRPYRRGLLSAGSTTILFGLLLVLTGCGQPKTARLVPATSTLSGVLTSVQMITARVGWAISWDLAGTGAYHILKTVDGGHEWQTLLQCLPTLPEGKGFIEACSVDFHSALVATVVQPEYDYRTQISSLRIFHTGDGGQSWQSSVIVARDLETPAVFVDDLHGWVFATDDFPGPDPSSAYIGSQIALYRTSDGGKNWQRIAAGPATPQVNETTDDGYGIPPLAASARMQFISASTGWLIGTSLQGVPPTLTYYSWLYVTHDGGSSWQQVNLPFPPQALLLQQPTFFSSQVGWFPVLTSGPAPAYSQGSIVYRTQDGGQTWTGASMPFVEVAHADFIDLEHAVTIDSSGKDLLTTSDGWQHWTTLPLPTTFGGASQLDFITPQLGWVLAVNRTHSPLPEPGGGLQKGDVSALLQTTDGGTTWQEIAHAVV